MVATLNVDGLSGCNSLDSYNDCIKFGHDLSSEFLDRYDECIKCGHDLSSGFV